METTPGTEDAEASRMLETSETSTGLGSGGLPSTGDLIAKMVLQARQFATATPSDAYAADATSDSDGDYSNEEEDEPVGTQAPLTGAASPITGAQAPGVSDVPLDGVFNYLTKKGRAKEKLKRKQRKAASKQADADRLREEVAEAKAKRASGSRDRDSNTGAGASTTASEAPAPEPLGNHVPEHAAPVRNVTFEQAKRWLRRHDQKRAAALAARAAPLGQSSQDGSTGVPALVSNDPLPVVGTSPILEQALGNKDDDPATIGEWLERYEQRERDAGRPTEPLIAAAAGGERATSWFGRMLGEQPSHLDADEPTETEKWLFQDEEAAGGSNVATSAPLGAFNLFRRAKDVLLGSTEVRAASDRQAQAAAAAVAPALADFAGALTSSIGLVDLAARTGAVPKEAMRDPVTITIAATRASVHMGREQDVTRWELAGGAACVRVYPLPGSVTRASFFKSTGGAAAGPPEPAAFTVDVTDPVRDKRVKAYFRPAGSYPSLTSAAAWVGVRKGVVYILHFATVPSSGEASVLTTLFVGYVPRALEAYYADAALMPAEKALGRLILAQAAAGTALAPVSARAPVASIDAVPASAALAHALGEARDAEGAQQLAGSARNVAATADQVEVMHRYAAALHRLGARMQALGAASAMEVAQTRGALLWAYLRSKAPDTLTVPQLSHAVGNAWLVAHLHATRGPEQPSRERLARYWAAPIGTRAGDYLL